MGLQKIGALVLLILIISPSGRTKAYGMYDPGFCYVLDVFLLIYGIVITILFLREKCCKPKEKARRQMDDDTYTPLKDKTEDTYKSIQVKKDRRPNDQVYQGLSKATKDTYDTLHMQPLPPRR
ncbi:T-cell surface glycoprotein CD3 zeta chain precursor [Silurus meridionalis]|nr:T-cell surface glycoprotein CD3 zeta chain precursor [Silurus meridionalis]